MASPLHKVIDADRWDAEPPLGRMYGVPLEPTLMSLPDEVKVAIVGRLTDGKDLARVECTCTELRRLVADHDDVLWKPRFEALTQSAFSFFLPDDDDDDNDGAADDDDDNDGAADDDDDNDGAGAGETEVRSWKARYSSWRDCFSFSLRIKLLGRGHYGYSRSRLFEAVHSDIDFTTTPILIMPPSDWLLPSHGQTADAVPGRMRIRERKRCTSMPGHGRTAGAGRRRRMVTGRSSPARARSTRRLLGTGGNTGDAC